MRVMYTLEDHVITLRFKRLVWDARILDPSGVEIWRRSGFQDRGLALDAAVRRISGKGRLPVPVPAPIIVYDGKRRAGEIHVGDGGAAELRARSAKLKRAMESYEAPEDLFVFLRRKGFTLGDD